MQAGSVHDAAATPSSQSLRHHNHNTSCQLHSVSQVSKQQCLHVSDMLEVQGAEGKVREGVSTLAEVRRQGVQQQEEANKALQAQQAAMQAAQHQLQAAQVLHPQNQS